MRIAWVVLLAGAAWAQDVERATVAFSNPSGAKTLNATLLNGDVTVKAYSGTEVVVEARNVSSKYRRSNRQPPPGMRRIGPTYSGWILEEASNEVKLIMPAWESGDVTVQVPADTAVKIHTTMGRISVEGTSGEIEVHSTNGGVTLSNVSGAVVAYTMNGKLQVNMSQVPPKPMSFSTFNGEVDVTLPANVKADFKMKSQRGDIFSDFDMNLKLASQSQQSRGGRVYRVRFDRSMVGTVNGGGPEIQFTTFNGAIYIRKK